MQTAVDYSDNSSSLSNGTNSSGSDTNINTNTKSKDDRNATRDELKLPLENNIEGTSTATTTALLLAVNAPTLVITDEPATATVALRHRLTKSLATAATAMGYDLGQKNSNSNGNGHLIDDAADVAYMGSNVERMSITPSPTPQASPVKHAMRKVHATAGNAGVGGIGGVGGVDNEVTTLMENYGSGEITSDGSNSNSNSNSSSTTHTSSHNSTASSVIATPALTPLTRNGNAYLQQNGDSSGSSDCRFDLLTLPTVSATTTSMGNLYYSTMDGSSPSPSTTSPSVTPASSTPGTVSATGSMSISKSSSRWDMQLLQWKDMPQYLQFNPYVLHGYRPLTTFKGCLLSLFYWHNETVNILTHGIPIIYILAIVPGLMPWEKEFRFLSLCHLLGSVSPWCGSFIYHLFMNIELGEKVYYRLLKLDMVGIWVSQSFGALPLVTATTFCFSFKWKWFVIISYCLLSLWGLYKALTAASPWQRRLCFALPFTMRSFLTLLRTLGYVGGNTVALSHVYLQDGVSIIGGAIGAMRIPEKWFPGLVDYYFNSHNIMHVLVVVAVYSMHKATMKDFEWMSATVCDNVKNTTSNNLIQNVMDAHAEL